MKQNTNIFRIVANSKSDRKKQGALNLRKYSYLVTSNSLEEAISKLNAYDDFDILSTELVSKRKITNEIFAEV